MPALELIMPMAGRGSRFEREGHVLPKPLIPLFGRPLFAWAIEAVTSVMPDTAITCVVLEDHVERFGIDKHIIRAYPRARIVVLPEVTKGAVDTALAGLAAIDRAAPVVINDCDHYFGFPQMPDAVREMREGAADAVLCTFAASSPNYSFARFGNDGALVETAEKRAISDRAIAGAYGFASADIFTRAADAYRLNCPYDETFISGVYNELVREGRRVIGYPLDFHVPFGTPAELLAAERQPQRFRAAA
jgi:NDP-sugar pyrophosphorylase family protein